MSDKSNSLKQPQGSLGKTIRNYKLELGMTVILIVLYIVLHAVTGTALGKGNVMNVLQSAAPLLIMTMGQLLVVITGGIDLSVGSVYLTLSIKYARPKTASPNSSMQKPLRARALISWKIRFRGMARLPMPSSMPTQ